MSNPVSTANAEALRAALENIPVSVRDYLAKEFKCRFTRLVPAGEERIFSTFGEIGTEPTETPDTSSSACEDESCVEKD